ncbi:MAG: RNA 2'-phosphotransferase [bacterium]|nr:RNA 2'-phosphotransferase [bacterium]
MSYPEKLLTRRSKFLSLILRHDPGRIGLSLDPGGWASLSELVARAGEHGVELSEELVREVVATNTKQRFSLSDDGTRIRANQGHSIGVDLDLSPKIPPATLFHGTAARFVDSIRRQGLLRMRRRHVHLSADEQTALAVGRRHGKPVVLRVRSGAMHERDFRFFLSENGVWLTETVPPNFLEFPE